MTHAQTRVCRTTATRLCTSTVTRQVRRYVSSAMRAMSSSGKSSSTVSQDTPHSGIAHHPSVKVCECELVQYIESPFLSEEIKVTFYLFLVAYEGLLDDHKLEGNVDYHCISDIHIALLTWPTVSCNDVHAINSPLFSFSVIRGVSSNAEWEHCIGYHPANHSGHPSDWWNIHVLHQVSLGGLSFWMLLVWTFVWTCFDSYIYYLLLSIISEK